jgi:hypothetical protein
MSTDKKDELTINGQPMEHVSTDTIAPTNDVDYVQLEVDSRSEINNMYAYFGDKPFVPSQLAKKFFKGNLTAAKSYLETLNYMGGVVPVSADGSQKFKIVHNIAERKQLMADNLEELEDFIEPLLKKAEMLKYLIANIDTI